MPKSVPATLAAFTLLVFASCGDSTPLQQEEAPSSLFELEAVRQAPVGATWGTPDTKFIQRSGSFIVKAHGSNNSTFIAEFKVPSEVTANVPVTTESGIDGTVRVAFVQTGSQVYDEDDFAIIDISPSVGWHAVTASTVSIQSIAPLRIRFSGLSFEPKSDSFEPFKANANGEWHSSSPNRY
jgi:hypothetical protein